MTSLLAAPHLDAQLHEIATTILAAPCTIEQRAQTVILTFAELRVAEAMYDALTQVRFAFAAAEGGDR